MADSCAVTHTCAESDVSAARTKLIVADVAGLVAVACGIFFGWQLLGPSAQPPTHALR